MRPEDHERILVEVTSRVVERYVQAAKDKEGHLEAVLGDTLYYENLRLEKENPKDPAARAYRQIYDRARPALGAAPQRQRAVLTEITRHFAEEVVGNFNQRVYRLSTGVIPHGLSGLLRAGSPRKLLSPRRGGRRSLRDHLVAEGAVEHVRGLLPKGTLLVLPTHSSNLDSVVLGYSVYLMGIPPLLYGAGINLFTNPMLSFFMRNLGAYTVDRKKQSALYKDVLKEYSACALEMGYHSLFFPGGTRSRSGEVERRLKKGLMGTALQAYTNNLRAGKPKPDFFIVPATISYKLVLEGETLIEDYLKAEGKARYIIDDDEFSKPRRIARFMSNLMSLDSRIVITFSKPMDVFGNPVDEQGRSLDPRGRPIDPRSFVSYQGEPVHDQQRDREYTSELAAEVGKSFLRDNVVMSTNLVGFVLYDMLQRANPGMDRYRLLRTGGHKDSFPMTELHSRTAQVLDQLKELDDGPRLGPLLRAGDVQEIVSDALKHFGIYHNQPAALRRGDRVFHQERGLLLFYGNRLRGYDLGRKLRHSQA